MIVCSKWSLLAPAHFALAKVNALSICGKICLPEEKTMRKLIVLSAAPLLAGALAGGVQATPLSTAAAIQRLC